MVIDRLVLEGRLTQLALMQVFTIWPICLFPVIGIVNQLVHFAEVSELAGINFSHGGPPLWGYHIAIAKYGSTPHHPEGYSLSSSRSRGNYGLRRGERNRPLGQSESLIQLVVSFQVKYG